MFWHSWLKLLHKWGGEFWLPLPFLAILFWWSGDLMAEQVLSRSYKSVNKLQADTQVEVNLAVTIMTIKANISRDRGTTRVTVKTTDDTLKKLEYEFPVTEVKQVEQAIAQELNMPPAQIRKLVRYQLSD